MCRSKNTAGHSTHSGLPSSKSQRRTTTVRQQPTVLYSTSAESTRATQTRVPSASGRHMGGTGTGHVTVMSLGLSCGATAVLRECPDCACLFTHRIALSTQPVGNAARLALGVQPSACNAAYNLCQSLAAGGSRAAQAGRKLPQEALG